MARTPLIAGNWKMYKTPEQAEDTARRLRGLLAEIEGVDVVVCPPFTGLVQVGEALRGTNMELGAQNMHWELEGPYTGEVSAPMLWELGCTYVILGHSERRQHFGETDEMVQRKVATALTNELVPILCVGETLGEREEGQTEAVVRRQLEVGTRGFAEVAGASLVVAYEPVWAIGTGRAATGGEANRVTGLIRTWLREWFGQVADATRILYGGSITLANAAEFIGQPDIDGGLVGGASLDPEAFSGIVKAAVPKL